MTQPDMADFEDTLRDSPVNFQFAVAYALHPEMRRLIILHIVGVLLLSAGLSLYLGPTFFGVIDRVIGLVVVIVGATFLFGGLVGALFKLVTDANLLAMKQ